MISRLVQGRASCRKAARLVIGWHPEKGQDGSCGTAAGGPRRARLSTKSSAQRQGAEEADEAGRGGQRAVRVSNSSSSSSSSSCAETTSRSNRRYNSKHCADARRAAVVQQYGAHCASASVARTTPQRASFTCSSRQCDPSTGLGGGAESAAAAAKAAAAAAAAAAKAAKAAVAAAAVAKAAAEGGRPKGRSPKSSSSSSSSSHPGNTQAEMDDEDEWHVQHQESLGLYPKEPNIQRPQRIIIVRHGESMGNKDESTYVHMPDWKIPLTSAGMGDARSCGHRIKQIVGDKPIFFYTSPYMRTKQTTAGIAEALADNHIVGVREEPRLTEQQFGNFQSLSTIRDSKEERHRFGRFYYRFPQGESGLDVYNRATSFIATLFRDFANEALAKDDLNVVIVTHGLTMRLLVMRWFQYSIPDFENTHNPGNGDFVIMERKRHNKQEWYELTEDSLEVINFKPQRDLQYGSLHKLLAELPTDPFV